MYEAARNELAQQNGQSQPEKVKNIFYLGSNRLQVTAAAICFLVTAVMVYLVYNNPVRGAIRPFVVLTALAVLGFFFILLTFTRKSGIYLFIPAFILIAVDLIWLLPFSDSLADYQRWLLLLISLMSFSCLVRYYRDKEKTPYPLIFVFIARDLVLYCPMLLESYRAQYFGGVYLLAVVAITLLLPILFKVSIILTIINIKRKEAVSLDITKTSNSSLNSELNT